jgi:hypothetical protein
MITLAKFPLVLFPPDAETLRTANIDFAIEQIPDLIDAGTVVLI